jgi:hypothetical protein
MKVLKPRLNHELKATRVETGDICCEKLGVVPASERAAEKLQGGSGGPTGQIHGQVEYR